MKNNYFTSKKYKTSKIVFGFFTKLGGSSKKKYKSLNCSKSNGDNNNLVMRNIEIALKKIKLNANPLKLINQIHSNKIININKNNFDKIYSADGIISEDKNVNIAVLTADCCPIFIFDTDSSFICCIHVGWKGCFSNIIENAINKIKKIQPKVNKIIAIIGPCLNKNNFEVGQDFRVKFIKKNIKNKNFFYKIDKTSKYLFDMRSFINKQIKENNIKNIDNIDLDTYSNKNLFFSHRRSTHLGELPTGRMINIIGFTI